MAFDRHCPQGREHHDDRVPKSLTRIPPTLHRLVTAVAAALMLLILVYPFHRTATDFGRLLLAGLVLAFANRYRQSILRRL